jgi:hypothetical protein
MSGPDPTGGAVQKSLSARSQRFSRRLAFGFALFLAVAEIVRDWGDWGFWPFWVVDFLAAGLLVAGARASRRQDGPSGSGGALLSGAWGFTCAMFYMSFFSHLERLAETPAPPDHGPLPHARLTVAIGALFAVTVVGFVLSLGPFGRRGER